MSEIIVKLKKVTGGSSHFGEIHHVDDPCLSKMRRVRTKMVNLSKRSIILAFLSAETSPNSNNSIFPKLWMVLLDSSLDVLNTSIFCRSVINASVLE